MKPVVYAVVRPYSLADKYLFFSSLLLFFSSVGAFAATYVQLSKALFMLFLLLFVIFLVSRVKMQFGGMRITLFNISDGTITFIRLKTLPFFETETAGVIHIPVSQVTTVVANRSVPRGAASDPSYTIGFKLKDGSYVYNEIPYALSEKVTEILVILKNNLPNVEFDTEPWLADF